MTSKQQYETTGYVWKIFIDGKLQYQRVNRTPRTFVNVQGRMGNSYEPGRNYATAVGRWRNLKLKSFETPQYCVKVTSGDETVCRNNPKYRSWDGGAVELHFKTKDFDNHVATMNPGEKEMKFCLPIDQVNLEDDIWTLQSTSNDGVCITSLIVNNEQLLVGKNNDKAYFWLDENDLDCTDEHMSTDVLSIQNSEVYYSECKSDYIRPDTLIYEDVTVYKTYDFSVMLNFEENTHKGWSNIFGFFVEGTKVYSGDVGSRIPSVWLRPNSNALHICTALNNRGNRCWNSSEMPVNTWFKLKIQQFLNPDIGQYVFRILIDDVLQKQVINSAPMIFENVDGVFGNRYQPERNYNIPAGQYKDFEFSTVDL